MNRWTALLLVLSLVAGGCVALPHDERGDFKYLGDCKVAPPPGWSHCDARLRPWGKGLQP